MFEVTQRVATPTGGITAPVPPGGQSAAYDTERTGTGKQLAEKWTGHYDVLLITHTALKLPRVTPWIQHTPVQEAPLEKTPKSIESAWTCALTKNLKLFFKKQLRRTRKVVKGLRWKKKKS